MALGLTEKLSILITADGKGAVTEFDKVAKGADRSLGRAESRADKFGSALTKVGAISLGLGVAAAAGMNKAANAAGNLEQSAGAIESVFGPAAAKIEAFGETAAQVAGLSRREVNEMAARVGASLKGLGFDADEAADVVINLEERAADLAATFGGTTAEAIDAIASLMRGERDPIERYGVSIKQVDVAARVASMGLGELDSEGKKLAEGQAALDLLFEQTADAAGQFAREADTTAGAAARAGAEAENLAADVGEVADEIKGNLLGAANSLLNKFNELDPSTRSLVARVAAFGTGALVAVGGVSLLVGQVIKARAAFRLAATAVSSFSTKLAAHKEAAAGAGIALLGILSILDEISDRNAKAEQAFDRMVDALRGAATEAEGYKDAARIIVEDSNDIAVALDDAGLTVDHLAAALMEGDIAVQQFGRDLAETAGTESSISAMEELATVASIMGEAAAAAAAKGRLLGDESSETAGAVGELTGATDDVAGATDAAADATDEYTQSIEGLFDEINSAIDAEFAYEDALDDTVAKLIALDKAELEHGRSSTQAAAAARDAATQIRDQALAAVEAAGVTIESAEGQQIFRAELANVAAALSPSSPVRQHLDSMIGKFANFGAEIAAQGPKAAAGAQSFGARMMSALGGVVDRGLSLIRGAFDATIGGMFATSQTQVPGLGAAISRGIALGFGDPGPSIADRLQSGLAEGMADNRAAVSSAAEENIEEPIEEVIITLEEKFGAFTDTISAALSSISAGFSLTEARDEVAALEAELLGLPGRIAAAEGAKTVADNELAAASKSLEQLEAQLRKLKEAGADPNKEAFTAKELEQLEREHAQAISLLQDDIADAKDKVKTAEDGVKTAAEELNDALEAQKTINERLRDAQMDLLRAQLASVEAQHGLTEAGQEFIDLGPEGIGMFQELAVAAGLTASEISNLIDRYSTLATVAAGGSAPSLEKDLAIAGSGDADLIRDRLLAIFKNRGLTPGAGQIDKLVGEVMGGRSFQDVRTSLDAFKANQLAQSLTTKSAEPGTKTQTVMVEEHIHVEIDGKAIAEAIRNYEKALA